MGKEHISPLVSVVVITYGHERFLLQCLESIVKQKTNFSYEIIISNDNSPDDSDGVIQKFIACNKKDNVTFRYFKHEINMGMTGNFIWTLSQSHGKYIAYCEGDDAWIDDNKLQLQVDYLDTHENISLCCGGFEDSFGLIQNIGAGKSVSGFEFTLEDNFKRWHTKSLTICFRNYPSLIPFLTKFKYARDIHLNYFLLNQGNGYYLNRVLGFYNIHEGGTVSLKSRDKLASMSYEVFNELYQLEQTKNLWQKVLVCNIINYKRNKKINLRYLHLNSIKDILLVIKALIRG